MRLLAANHLHALPLKADGAYLGWVRYEDLIGLLLQRFAEHPDKEEQHRWTHSPQVGRRGACPMPAPLMQPQEIERRGVFWANSPVSSVKLAASSWDEVYEHGTLLQLAEEMSDRMLHRVAVMTEKDVLHSVISATDVLGFLAENHRLWNDFGARTVEQLNLGSRNGECPGGCHWT